MSYSSSSSNSTKRVRCNCGIPVAEKTSWTHQNPSRRFMACKFYNAETGLRGCCFFKWIDEDMTYWQRSVINSLLNENKSLKNKIGEMEAEFEYTKETENKISEMEAELKLVKEAKKTKISYIAFPPLVKTVS